MGARFLPVTAAAILACASATAQTGDMARQDPPQSSAGEDVIDIAFDQDRYERMTVPVTIGGQGP